MRLAPVLIAAAYASTGCWRDIAFQCSASAECSLGTCEPTHFCSFDDPSCPNGRRYGEQSGMYANTCVGDGDAGVEGITGFSVGGTVSGLMGTGLVLRNNGGDDRPITTNGPFQFSMRLPDGSPYAVTAPTPPSGQQVTITNASGTIAGAGITNVNVLCTTAGADPGILCGTTYCTLSSPAELCCHNTSNATGMCIATGGVCTAPQIAMTCDDSADCGGLPKICCAHIQNNGAIKSAVGCVNSTSSCAAGGGETVQFLCDPNAGTMACPSLMSCVADNTHGWFRCL